MKKDELEAIANKDFEFIVSGEDIVKKGAELANSLSKLKAGESVDTDWDKELAELANQSESYQQAYLQHQIERQESLVNLAKNYSKSLDVNQQYDMVKLVDEYIKSLRGALATSTVNSYSYVLKKFAKESPILPLAPQPIEDYLFRHYGPDQKRAAHHVYSVLSTFYSCLETRYGIANVMKKVRAPKFKEKEVLALDLDEAKRVLGACKNDTELALIHLYLGHGLRMSEATRLNAGDIEVGRFLVRGKERDEHLPLLPETRELLLKLNGKGAIFMSSQKKRLSVDAVRVYIKGIYKRAGLPSEKLSTHTLRRTFATLSYRHGKDYDMTQRLLRHKTQNVTNRYLIIELSDMREYLELHSPLRLTNELGFIKIHDFPDIIY